MTLDPRLSRLDENRVRIHNPYGIDAVLFANESVPVEASAVTELVQMLDLSRTVERFADASPESFETRPAVTQVAVTPDFHKARGIPVGTVMATRGFVVPQSIGNDACTSPRCRPRTSRGARKSWTPRSATCSSRAAATSP